MEERKASEEEIEQQKELLQELVDSAFTSGLAVAIEKARKINNPYVLDAFHDILTDRLYKELVQRGKLEEL